MNPGLVHSGADQVNLATNCTAFYKTHQKVRRALSLSSPGLHWDRGCLASGGLNQTQAPYHRHTYLKRSSLGNFLLIRPSSLFEKTCKRRKIGKWVFGHCIKKLSPVFLYWIRAEILTVLQKRKSTSPLQCSSCSHMKHLRTACTFSSRGSNIPAFRGPSTHVHLSPQPPLTHIHN